MATSYQLITCLSPTVSWALPKRWHPHFNFSLVYHLFKVRSHRVSALALPLVAMLNNGTEPIHFAALASLLMLTLMLTLCMNSLN